MHQFVLCYDEDDVQWVRTLLRTNLYAKRSQEDQESDPPTRHFISLMWH